MASAGGFDQAQLLAPSEWSSPLAWAGSAGGRAGSVTWFPASTTLGGCRVWGASSLRCDTCDSTDRTINRRTAGVGIWISLHAPSAEPSRSTAPGGRLRISSCVPAARVLSSSIRVLFWLRADRYSHRPVLFAAPDKCSRSQPAIIVVIRAETSCCGDISDHSRSSKCMPSSLESPSSSDPIVLGRYSSVGCTRPEGYQPCIFSFSAGS